MFSDYAEFYDLLEQPESVKVSQIVHKAFIEVNENGVKAGAGKFFLRNFKIFFVIDNNSV